MSGPVRRRALALLVLACAAWAARPAAAVDPAADLRERGLVALEQALQDLRTLGRVMNLAAHPDDEDGATLALCRRGRGLRTFAVFATRGEGGQNERGPELGRELGAIREVETVRAAARIGAAPFFLGLPDFGYSKTPDETFARWTRTRTLERLVYALRRLRPDVVFTNHDPERGHGHHRALAIAMREAFDLAAREDAFVRHLEEDGLSPWAATLLLERIPASGDDDAPDAAPDDSADELVRLETDVADPVRGTTYREQAHRALKEHASQGRWTRSGGGTRTWRVVRRRHERFLRPGGDPFDPRDLTRLRLFRAIEAGGVPRDAQATLLDPRTFDAPFPRRDDRAALVQALLDRRDALAAAADGAGGALLAHDLARLRERFDRAIAAAAGVRFETTVERDPARGDVEVTRLVAADPARLAPESRAAVSADAPPLLERHGGRAAFLEPLWASPRYDAFDPMRPDAALERALRVDGDGRTFVVRGTASYRARPAVSVDFAPRLRVVRAAPGAPCEVETLAVVEVVDPLDRPVAARLSVEGAGGDPVWTGTLPADARGTHLVPIRFGWTRPPGRAPPLRLDAGPAVVPLHPLHVTRVDADVEGAPRVGLVRSYDDTLEGALRDLGVEARRLTSRDLAFGDLDALDVVLVDIRAYLVREDLVRFNGRLLDFAARGGTLGVFYQKTAEWNRRGEEDPDLAPFPLRVTRSRVVDEAAPVTLRRPDHPLLASPNRLGPADFAGWVHERGLYLPHDSYDDRYAELLSCHDAGEEPRPGGLLVAGTGAGWYVYTGYAWYRQWRAGVPGAYRFLANLVSLRGERRPEPNERR